MSKLTIYQKMSDEELILELRNSDNGSGLIYLNSEALARLLERTPRPHETEQP